MKWSMVTVAALILLAPGSAAHADHYDNRSPACGESSGFRRTNQGRLFGCLPFCCLDDCDDVCDCDTPCCEYCGGKRRPPKKKKCLLSCLGCEDVPRGTVGMSIAAKVNAFGESAAEESDRERSGESDADGKADEESAVEESRSRMDKLESDLTRLTLVVEELARGQRQQQEDLTRATLMLEKLTE
ncbi:MAG: hypothetical protein RLZZ436_1304 [Planctomycetota bacterium]|jgi:hypothetical protein